MSWSSLILNFFHEIAKNHHFRFPKISESFLFETCAVCTGKKLFQVSATYIFSWTSRNFKKSLCRYHPVEQILLWIQKHIITILLIFKNYLTDRALDKNLVAENMIWLNPFSLIRWCVLTSCIQHCRLKCPSRQSIVIISCFDVQNWSTLLWLTMFSLMVRICSHSVWQTRSILSLWLSYWTQLVDHFFWVIRECDSDNVIENWSELQVRMLGYDIWWNFFEK